MYESGTENREEYHVSKKDNEPLIDDKGIQIVQNNIRFLFQSEVSGHKLDKLLEENTIISLASDILKILEFNEQGFLVPRKNFVDTEEDEWLTVSSLCGKIISEKYPDLFTNMDNYYATHANSSISFTNISQSIISYLESKRRSDQAVKENPFNQFSSRI